MIPNGIDRLKELRESLHGQVSEYLVQLESVYEELKAEAVEFRDKIGSVTQTELPISSPKREQMNGFLATTGKPKARIIVDAINSIGEEVVAPHIIHIIRKTYSPQEISDKNVRNVLHKIATQPNSPLELVRRGAGNVPSVYRKIRRIEYG